MKRLISAALVISSCVAVALSLGACSSPIPNRVPLGEPFPSLTASALDEVEGTAPVNIPEDFAGEPLLLLVGYVQDSQFDIDRWLFGILDAGLDVALREVPAARGMAASLASGFIDGGMRRGIPKGEWGAVVTTYGKTADKIARVTGTERPRNARVLLLDREGLIRWFHDGGYSAGTLIELRSVLGAL